jgi:hypothetical protein
MISQHCLGIQNQTETKNLWSKERITPAAPASQPASQQQQLRLLVQQHFSDTSPRTQNSNPMVCNNNATTMQQQCKLSKERKLHSFIQFNHCCSSPPTPPPPNHPSLLQTNLHNLKQKVMSSCAPTTQKQNPTHQKKTPVPIVQGPFLI